MNKRIAKTFKILSTVLVIAMVLLAFLLVGIRLFGIQVYTILSGSMEPNYPVGSLIYVTKVDAEALQERDVITYRLTGETTATHRIVEVVRENGSVKYRTQGDANEHPDNALVSPSQIIGSPVVCLPGMGYFAEYIQNPPGLYVAITAGAFLVFLVVLSDLLDDEKDKKKEEKKAAKAAGKRGVNPAEGRRGKSAENSPEQEDAPPRKRNFSQHCA